ncbi:DUF4855 domain-containing protein [Paenibacillus sp. LHD-117]|uniref:DUF4855 domain-containing protein n=1 Tax=Paenibacillus sp. LHD-117 TaxID=3071412 RepID=UPI0027E02D6C|nr:DUF4855 domain-containing protein [Paenibacillus sp. LHD-117]MDQ6422415.1 DUF4855 domain-containing protein [Paenibacillus sp. LHD-117]
MMKRTKKWMALAVSAAMLLALAPSAYAETQGQEAAQPEIQAEADGPQLRNLALGLDYEWSEAPEAAYPDGARKLTDGVHGALNMSDPAWVGHVKKMTREVVFDLGERKSISAIKARFMQDWPTNSMLVPLTVSMYASDDKVNWGTLTHKSTQLLWGDGPPREEVYEWNGSADGIKSGNLDADMAYARYVKVTFSMHTRAWTFIDEIEIIGADGQVAGAVAVPAEQPALLAPGEATAGIHNLGLLYNGHYPNGKGDWTKERIIPNISYVNKDGVPVDRLFDGILYLGLTSSAGRGYNGGANKSDWEWYLNKTFAATGDMYQLNEANKEVGAKLAKPDEKLKVVLMIPDPGEYMTDFGDVDGDGVSENFSASSVGELQALSNREKVVQWWLDLVQQRWTAAGYSHLELVGLYWLEEQISTGPKGPDLLKSTSVKVHNEGLKFFWIPHFLAYKAHMWKDVGIDAVSFQPNYFFEPMDVDRLEDAANIAKRYGMSLELEFDDRMMTDAVFRERYIDYLNSGAQTGLMQSGFKAYYQGNNAVYDTAVSADPATRVLYDWLYQFAKGTYVVNNALPPEAEVRMNGELLQGGASIPETEKVQFTWDIPNDDGSGLTKVTAAFNGKPYTEGTEIDLAGKPGKHELVVTVAAGKSRKTTYVIEAEANASTMKAAVDRFGADGAITDAAAVRSLNNYLELMKRYKGIDETKAEAYTKGFNAKLDLFKQQGVLTDGAYNALKESVYYLIGNLATDKTAEASTVEAGSPNLMPAKAVDGFPSTRWASELYDNTWFQVDLGESKELDTVRIDWEYARAKTYKLLVSGDKQTWTNVMGQDALITAKDGKETVRFEPISARYVKFEGVKRETFYGYSFYEFGVFQLEGEPEEKRIDGVRASIDAASKKVTVDGLIMNGDLANVSLKVMDPKGKLHHEADTASTEAGSFRFEFTLTGNTEGIYEAYVSTDDMNEPMKVTFEYKKPAPGGGGGDPVTPSVDLFKPQADGSVKAEISAKPEQGGKTAVGTVGEQDLRKAIAAAKPDKDGKLRATIVLKGTGDAELYALDFPSAFLSDYPNLTIEAQLPSATVLLAGDMLPKTSQTGKQLRVNVRERDGRSLKPDVRGRVAGRPVLELSMETDGKTYEWKNEKAAIVVTVPYSLASQELPEEIGVLSIADGEATDVPSAAYFESGKHIRFQTNQTGLFAVYRNIPAPDFADLNQHVWAQEAVAKLAELGIVNGTSTTAFSPSESVSRADFILMLVRALDLRGTSESEDMFPDVDPHRYYAEAVAIAKQLGIVTGKDEERFAPEDKVSRQEMMVMAARAIAAVDAGEIGGDPASLEAFKDAGSVSGYAAETVAGMVEAGLIRGNGGSIKPSGQATRAETAIFLYRLLAFINAI